jgi:adenylate kinase family enzyme
MHYFIFGPSGSGKTYIAEKFAASVHALWLEAGQADEDGITALGLRSEWDAFDKLNCHTWARRRMTAGRLKRNQGIT